MSPLLSRATYTNHFVRHLSVRPSTCFPTVTIKLFSYTFKATTGDLCIPNDVFPV